MRIEHHVTLTLPDPRHNRRFTIVDRNELSLCTRLGKEAPGEFSSLLNGLTRESRESARGNADQILKVLHDPRHEQPNGCPDLVNTGRGW